ncbi:MAG TPA: Cro/CI family transcriptional regulator [Anaerolineae bacterium]|nr:Cro/CI family transcriptional regulator [Anaerolineae bacterium]
MKTALNDAISMLGGLAAFASALDESPQTVSNWRGRGVPVKPAVAIERLTDSRVMRWHLRPTDWHEIWPELVTVHGAPLPPISALPASACVANSHPPQVSGDEVDGREERAAA